MVAFTGYQYKGVTRFAEAFDVTGACASSSGCEGPSPPESLTSEGGSGGAPAEKKKRERGTAWSEEEHKLFLVGLEQFGKGDWRSISRQSVLTRRSLADSIIETSTARQATHPGWATRAWGLLSRAPFFASCANPQAVLSAMCRR